MEPKMIVLERTEKVGGYSKDHWESFMPSGSTAPTTVRYAKRGVKVLDIKSVIEIPKNKDECMILFYDGEEIIVKGSFATVYEQWVDAEDFEDEDLYL